MLRFCSARAPFFLLSVRAPASTDDRTNITPRIRSTNQSVRCREMKRGERSLVAPGRKSLVDIDDASPLINRADNPALQILFNFIV
jgi:hypothetical protein